MKKTPKLRLGMYFCVVCAITLLISRLKMSDQSLFFSRFDLAYAFPLIPFFTCDPEAVVHQKITLVELTTAQQTLESQLIQLPDEVATILVTGDVLLARSVNARMVKDRNFRWPWEEVAEELRMADLTYVNLETPLVEGCPVRHDGMIFCGDPRAVEGLQFAGVDVVNFANNHAGNWGQDGVDQTLQLMKVAGIEVAGFTHPIIVEKKGIKFAFLGYNDVERQVGIANYEQERMRQEITQARQQADVVIVQFHSGPEYRRQPHARQIELSHLAVDFDADLVIGNHPHWWQPAEFYKDKLIVYSHGNFIFDQMWSPETREGMVGKYSFQDGKLVKVEFQLVENV